ncbi:PepSY domain-containing protein [Litoribacillus peritrichatus]|uniref:PepSY domain-containing protein n=1 Tax=Litoribacillus peritrichatus TaxID=718191 RepID=A0ABP7MHL2_9GAMM
MKQSKNLRKSQLKLHNQLLWWSAAFVAIWVISGICHPLMSWFGPKQVAFKPPVFESESLSSQSLEAISNIIVKTENSQWMHGKELRVAKVVPSANAPLLQLTITGENAPETNPIRQYFDLDTQQRVDLQDEAQARWLASHYTGRSQGDIVNIEKKTEFDEGYPWVNRLLPVYVVTFQGDDKLTAYVHTETMALASLTNETKSFIQWVFQVLHTFNIFDAQDNLRVAGVFLAMLCLTGMSISGLFLIMLIKSRKIKQGERRWHRRLSYVVVVPLFAWSVTGAYHLVQMAYVESAAGMRLAKPLEVDSALLDQVPDSQGFNDSLSGLPINAISLVQLDSETLKYRVSVANQLPEQGMNDQQKLEKKYQGRSTEYTSLYFDVGSQMKVGDRGEDRRRAVELALQFSGETSDSVISVDRVTHFGPDYDFRNKRLPVWKIALGNEDKSVLFIDPTTGILVDQTHWLDRPERWAFSTLHKWNFLIPVMGRFNRDVLVVTVSVMTLCLTFMGVLMALKRRSRLREKETSKGLAVS